MKNKLFQGKFHMAFSSEISSAKNTTKYLSGQIHISRLLPHEGNVELYDDELVLQSGKTSMRIPIRDLIDARRGFDNTLKRRYFMGLGAGASGGPGRIGAISGGEPLKISYKADSRVEKTFYMVIDWNPVTGRNRNKELLSVVKRLLAK